MQVVPRMKALRPGVVRIIEKHLPNSSASEQTGNRVRKISHGYADMVLSAVKEPEARFGYASKTEESALNRLAKAATEFERSILALPEGTLENLFWAYSAKPISTESSLNDTMRVASALNDSAKTLERARRSLPVAKKHRDWRMAAIAGACREIWAIEEWRTNPNKYGPTPIFNALSDGYAAPANQDALKRYRNHLKTCAPKHEKPSPGPMGRFLEETLLVTGGYKRGKSPSAQSALTSWRGAVSNF